MSITDKNIIELRDAFQKLKTKEDLIQLLNRSNFFLYGEKSEDFKLKSLTYYSNPRLSGDCYIEFKINKKSGGQRVIHAPNKGLKAIQGALNLVLQSVYEPHIAATGFVRNKSIVDNARKHVGKHYVFNTDLKDFFPSIDQARFWGRLQYPPFNLNEDYGKLEIANRISALCFTNLEVDRKINGKWIKEIKPVLPQGAPTSPTISNIIAESLDRKLTGLADRFGCVYTRYADDLSFSSQHNVYKENGAFRNELTRIVESQNFYIKESKTRLIEDDYRQEVTGLTVNEKVNVKRKYVKQLRMWLYYWETYGYEKACKIFEKDYLRDKGHVKNGEPNFEQVIHGKLQFLKMVKGANDGTYEKLYGRYQSLASPEDEINKSNVQINELMESTDDKEDSPKPLNDYRDPIKTSKFLKEFNQNIFLKSTSHLIDENLLDDINQQLGLKEYDYFKHIEKIENEYIKLKNKYFISSPLIGKIDEYLLNLKGEGWSKDDIKIGWKSEELIKWCKENPGKCPNPDIDLNYVGFELQSPKMLKDGSVVNSFNDVLAKFKNETQFRDESDLKNIVKRINREHYKGVNIDITNMNEGVRFYSDVEKIEQAYKGIIKMSKYYHEKESGRSDEPIFQISLNEIKNEKSNCVVFRIWHLNSRFGKSVDSNIYGKDFTQLINKQINGLCNFKLRAEFLNKKYVEIDIWPKTGKPIIHELPDLNGVQFDLIFYRTK